ncbi:MAG: hypothetical protein HQK50_04270 [Oligoflexia bacterium]|nr:hypothetical protein [Oligoflexia bacterium]MBF0364760.1 hypothetical protein [Oligoflexia bacterium]
MHNRNNREINYSETKAAWIENLALEELNMEESGVIHYHDHLDPLPYVEESSIEFMGMLREKFEFYLNKFNFYRGNKDVSSIVKIFKISNTVNDFMLFRSSLKLIVARKAANVITIGLYSNTGGAFAPRMSMEEMPTNIQHEIHAHIGPFNEISWRFNGEPVNVDAMVKHYLTEFIKHSAK